ALAARTFEEEYAYQVGIFFCESTCSQSSVARLHVLSQKNMTISWGYYFCESTCSQSSVARLHVLSQKNIPS
ncbi:hypothetical protein PSX43_23380, partial [Shigella flexneri]|nr:hypothetical protein [Shigella flexneri]